MKAGKSPRPDGLPAEFYNRFWPLLGNWLLKSLLSGFEKGGLSFAAAFDTLDRQFLKRALNSIKFGRKFCSWVEILYKGACGCVLNNGFSSDWFTLDAGLRQGCPLSPWFFILAVEKLAQKLRADNSIHGAMINGNSHVVSQYADDTTLFLKDSDSLEKAFDILDEFAECAGLKVNINKTQGLKVNALG